MPTFLCYNLDGNNTKWEAVNLLCVHWIILNSFWRHAYICAWTHGEGKLSCSWVLIAQPCHSKVGHFASHITDQQHIVTGEISVDDAIGGEMRERGWCHDKNWLGCGRVLAVGSFPENGSGCRPSAPLEVLGGQCQDLDKFPDIGQYLDVLWHSRTHTLAQTFSLVACALSEVLLDAVQLDQREFHAWV